MNFYDTLFSFATVSMHSTIIEQPPILLILGPTASGKSALAFAVAKKINAEIISADSRQVYCELNIGTAKPPKEKLYEVKHHFIDEKNIGEPFSAGKFAAEAIKRIQNLYLQGKQVVVAGGSTLYIEGLLKGFADLPPENPEIRQKLLHELENKGKKHLFKKLLKLDPEQAETLDPTKTHRLIRSLEIIEITGKSVTELQKKGKKAYTNLRFVTVALEMPRETLYQRINQRTDEMIEAGLCNEAEALYTKYNPMLTKIKIPSLQSVGYQELFQYFDGQIDFQTSVNLIQQHTRNYAKRQLTFFKNRLNVNWVVAPRKHDELQTLVSHLVKML